MKKPPQRQPFAAFTVKPSGIDGAVRHENGCEILHETAQPGRFQR